MYFIHTFFKYQQETFMGQIFVFNFKIEINCINEIHNYFIENKYDK